jgi:hypothetical protein
MRLLTILLVVFGSIMPRFACAADLFLRIDEVDYVSDLGQQPTPNVRSSLQLAIRPGEPFYGRAKIAGRTIVIRGTSKPGTKPDYYDIEFRVDIHTGEFVTAPGGQRPGIYRKTINTSVSAKVGERLAVGDLVTHEDAANGAGRRQSMHKFILLIAASEPGDDDPPPLQ